MNKPVVIHFMGMISPEFAAMDRFNIELSRQLNDRNYKPVFVYNELPKHKELIEGFRLNNAEMVELPINVSIIRLIVSVSKILRKYNPQAVHCHFSFRLVRIVILRSWLMRVPKRFVSIRSMPGNPTLLSKLWYIPLSWMSTKVFTVSDAIRNQLINGIGIKPSRVETLRMGIDLKEFDAVVQTKNEIREKYKLPVDKKLIGCVAFHQPIKGVDVLLDAIAALKEMRSDDFLLCQVGDYPSEYSDFIKRKVVELGITDQVLWMGIQNKVPELLHAFDVYCQPSRSEGLPSAILEAFAAGLPVVATNVGGIPEIVKDLETGLLVASEDYHDMANQIQILLENKILSEKISNNASDILQKEYYNKNNIVKWINKYHL